MLLRNRILYQEVVDPTATNPGTGPTLVPPPLPPDASRVGPPKSEDSASLLAQIKAEAAALASAREALQRETEATRAWRENDIANQRRQYVRAMGLAVDFSDEDLDKLVPAEDPRSEAGKAKIQEWRGKGGARYFSAPVPAPSLSQEQIVQQIVGPENAGRRLFGAAHVQHILANAHKRIY